MRKKLFELLFEVAEKRSPSKTRNGVCTYLENAFTKIANDSFNKETFIRYYKKYIEEKNITYNPNAELLNRCAQYLEYDNYEDFVMKNNQEIDVKKHNDNKTKLIEKKGKKTIKSSLWTKKNQKIIIINVIIIVALIVIISTDVLSKKGERWMLWKGSQYTEAKFSVTKYYNGELIPYDQNKIDSFKEIENPDCDTKYFNNQGKPLLWYYKVGKGNLEVFTGSGYHPIHRKPLKSITRYMVREHICKEY